MVIDAISRGGNLFFADAIFLSPFRATLIGYKTSNFRRDFRDLLRRAQYITKPTAHIDGI
jgi:hypothetical protein